ncbi:MAG: DUF1501 domain-containing protein [Bryobacterales bacterium]|nr:DUF1501 domain-containing protein [Bryobacteraceae bacterium]MDW8355915.1 DUF1501 domain-containing protein [Bryobacterales bacterium]
MKDRFGLDWGGISGTNFWSRPEIGRRVFFRHLAAAVGGYFLLPGRSPETVAHAAVTPIAKAKNCIFILLAGGPSHIDTFDLKEGPWTPREFNPTTYGEIRFPQGLMPTLAEHIESLALLRSVRAWAAVHGLAQTWVQIGRNPTSALGKIAPHIGSVVSLELGPKSEKQIMPAFVSLNTSGGVGAGYLPAEHSPFFVSPTGGGLGNTTHRPEGRDDPSRFDVRYQLLLQMDSEWRAGPDLGAGPAESAVFRERARALMYNPVVEGIFTFSAEERARYGNNSFGNACITARNLLRAGLGTRFVQITLGGWDNHSAIYTTALNAANENSLARQFDKALGTLIADLKADGTFDHTLIVAMGEFGRTVGPLNAQNGRDHFLQQTVLMAGAGIRGGRVIGATDAQGSATTEPGWSRQRDIRPEDIEATIYSALGIDWTTVRYDDPLGRGFEYVPFSDRDLYGPVHELWS